MRRTALFASVAAATLFLTGCGSGSNSLEDITVSDGDTPKLTVQEGFTTSDSDSRVITEGDGDTVETGDTIKINYIAVNGRTGEEFDNSYASGRLMPLTLDEQTTLPGFQTGLIGKKVGSRVLLSVSPDDGTALLGSAESLGLEAEDSMVFLFDIVAKVPNEAHGTPKKAPKSLPELTLDDDGTPTGFKATKSSKKKVGDTTSSVLIKGDGPKVEEGQLVMFHYLGQTYPDGDVFDQSWGRQPLQVQLGTGNLIPCWDDELVGQTIGSRVIVACSVDDAYGDDAAANGQPEGELLFVVDLLDTI